ncbi:MAG: hypothetical protein LAO20_06210 [Acidobacteriia bacterium]|nr:hypothetical protein [Terriglobia bacterium]
MKNFLKMCVALLLLAILGCPGGQQAANERDQAGKTNVEAPAPAIGSDNSQPAPADATATGGSSLTASAPYKQAGAGVAQNVNAAPFMIATQPAGKTATQSSDLISRADGTMMGPNDQMAAGTGPGGQGMGSAVPPKPAAPAKQASKPTTPTK